ncbi:hypothetical protein FDP41_001931 [Naegleria fowleri]|uniref:Uncharacterized protein n=1 Tax=Naegleria fowleri TaxID=5763 RepID=A0A6A5BWM1_NAEFO|nr:uncharacterized protein FDP41_001931 [Naegleria fowleri]KAF0978861.1 hypothetical protein FDP41_001931 [Naegleria fowleri]CAG4718767.1 unnamed protein product [Naegleria fowleri]
MTLSQPLSGHHSSQPLSFPQKLWRGLKKLNTWTLGNRRLRMYLLSVFKIVVISFVQANDLLGITTYHLSPEEFDVQLALKITSYIVMVGIPFLFTFRYIRELIAVRRKKPLTIWINWVESIIFFIFVLYSIGTAIIHIVYLGREYAYNYKKREKDPSYFANKSASLEEHLAVEILEIFVQLYVILEKASHYTHANHSVSIFLSNAAHIPKEEGGHGGHGSSHHVEQYHLVENDDDDGGLDQEENNANDYAEYKESH